MADKTPNTQDAKLTPQRFTFSRKKGTGTYTAIQFAEKVLKVGTRGKAKDKVLEKRDISKFAALTEREIDALLAEYEIDPKIAKLLGGNLVLRQRAAKGGMADVIIGWLIRDNISFPNAKDADQLAKDRRQVASTVLANFNAKTKQGKKTTIEKCYASALADD